MIKKINQIIDSIALNKKEDSIGLISGQSGIALFYYYCSTLINKDDEEKCFNTIEEALQQINNGTNISTFCSGLAGFGWTLEFLKEKNLFTNEDIELLDNLDEYLYKQMIIHFNNKHYDYLHGAIGYGLYFLKRLHKEKSTAHLTELVNKLELMAEKGNNGCLKWESVIDHKEGTRGYNISLSHGMASIVAVLTKIYKADIEKDKCKQLITGAVNYILAQEIDNDKYYSYFPSISLESSEIIASSRLAWCYGDLGVAMSIWQAGQALNREDWITKSLEVLLYAANERRDLNKNMVLDAGLCHGAAGIGHIFYRMWYNTKLPEFKAAADYWFDVTLKMAYHQDGLAGYKSWRTEEYGGWQNETSLLEGVAGIGLVLMSYYYEIDPDWDECLLLS